MLRPVFNAATGSAGPTDTARPYPLLGLTITPKLSSAETGGVFALAEYCAPPHFRGHTAHCHRATTELFYVLDGMLAFARGAETVTAKRGESILVQPETMHVFWNPTAAAVTFLVMCLPGGLEAYFAELATMIAAETNWPPVDMSMVTALNARYDIMTAPE